MSTGSFDIDTVVVGAGVVGLAVATTVAVMTGEIDTAEMISADDV